MEETLKVKLNLQFALELPKEYDELGQLKTLAAHVSPWLDDVFTDMRVAQMVVKKGGMPDDFEDRDCEAFDRSWVNHKRYDALNGLDGKEAKEKAWAEYRESQDKNYREVFGISYFEFSQLPSEEKYRLYQTVEYKDGVYVRKVQD